MVGHPFCEVTTLLLRVDPVVYLRLVVRIRLVELPTDLLQLELVLVLLLEVLVQALAPEDLVVALLKGLAGCTDGLRVVLVLLVVDSLVLVAVEFLGEGGGTAMGW